MYEAGVIYGSNYEKGNIGIVIPILFEPIPEWFSWIDKSLNRYVPIKMQDSHGKILGKKGFFDFIHPICNECQIANGVDFGCMFVHTRSKWAEKASSKDRLMLFESEMQSVLVAAYNLKAKYNLPVERLFRVYIELRTESFIRIDILYHNIICGADGYLCRTLIKDLRS